MNITATERQNRILEIAETDMISQVWARSYADCREAFAQFAAQQPEDIRNMLYGYADCGRMMQQRLVNLACENMRLPEEQ